MKKTRLLSIVVLATTILTCSTALATSLIGPPTAGLSQGQFAVGGQYALSEMCVELVDGSDSTGASMADRTVDELKMHTVIATLGYGIMDSWEGMLRVGGTQGEWDEDRQKFDGDMDLYFGIGTRVTLHEGPDLSWGGLVQVDWAKTEGKNTGAGWAGDTDIDFMHLRIAGGPTYNMTEKLAIYGGPFYQYIDGDKDYRESTPAAGYKESYDVEACSDFGGFLGARFAATENIICNVETQFTGDDWVLGVALAWLLGGGQ